MINHENDMMHINICSMSKVEFASKTTFEIFQITPYKNLIDSNGL